MSPRFKPPIWVLAGLLISTACAIWVGAMRHKIESAHKSVHLVAAIEDVRLVAAASAMKLGDALLKLEDAGLTGVVVSEDTFEMLLAQPVRGRSLEPEIYERIRRVLKERLPSSGGPDDISMTGLNSSPPLPYGDLKTFGMGFDPAVCKSIQSSGLTLITRVANPPSVSEKAIAAIVKDIKDAGGVGVIFTGDQVLGWRNSWKATADELKTNNIWYGAIEYGNQAGDRLMQKEMLDGFLRVHSVVAAEMAQNPVNTIVDRYVRAATERNIRVLFLRPPGAADANPVEGFATYISSIKTSLESKGSAARTPTPISAPDVPSFVQPLLAIGPALLGFWFFAPWFLHKLWKPALGFVAVVLVVGSYTGQSQSYISLWTAVLLPIFACMAVLDSENKGGGLRWVGAFFLICIISLVGGLHVAAMNTELSFMVHLEQFRGVKIAHLLPPIIVAILLVVQQASLKTLLSSSVRWFDMALVAVVGGGLFLTILRTGNDAPGAVSGWELTMRDFMDRMLPERPRTKEAFLGIPALVVALGLCASDNRRFVPLLGLITALGQASIVNTFCHLHTPLMVSVVRVFVGMVCGGILGVLIWLLIRRPMQGASSSQT